MPEVRVLGALRLADAAGSEIDPASLRTRKTRDLLRLLAVHGQRPTSVDRLTEALWSESAPDRAYGSLRTAVSHIRRVLGGDCVRREGGGFRLQGVWSDVQALEDARLAARGHLAGGETELGLTAVRTVRVLGAEPLEAECPDTGWDGPVQTRLTTQLRELLTDAAEEALRVGWLDDAITFAGDAIRLAPVYERPYRLLIAAYRAQGEGAEAMSTFWECKTMLVEEFGLDPSPATFAEYEAVLRTSTAAAPLVAAAPEAPPGADLGELCARREVDSQVLGAAGVLGDGLDPASVAGLLDDRSIEDVATSLAALEDHGLLELDEGGRLAFAQSALRRAALRAVTAPVRRTLHQRAGRDPRRSLLERCAHLEHAGDVDGVVLLLADRGELDDPEAPALLERAEGFVATGALSAREQLRLLEAIGDAAVVLGQPDVAGTGYERALALARRSNPAAAARLLRKRGALHLRAGEADRAHAWYRHALDDLGEVVDADSVALRIALGETESLHSLARANETLRQAVDDADLHAGLAEQVRARRALSSRVLVPRRELAEATRLSLEALDLPDPHVDPGLLAEALLASKTAASLLGDAAAILGPLRRARQLARRATQPLLQAQVDLHHALAEHALGYRAADTGMADATAAADRCHPEPGWRWMTLAALVDRGELAQARPVAHELLTVTADPTTSQLIRLHAARLAEADDDLDGAAELLLDAWRRAETTGAVLLSPELAARLAILSVRRGDPDAAGRYVRSVGRWVGTTDSPRERSLLLLARSALLLADGQPRGALVLVRAAAKTASSAGLVHDTAGIHTAWTRLQRSLPAAAVFH